MTTEITSPLPPCPLPDCMGVEHHWHDIAVYAVTETHDCAKTARRGYRCYGPHQPGLSGPIDLQLAAGSDEVALPRDAAALVACALHDLLDLLAQAWAEGYKLDWTGGVRYLNPYRQETNHG